MLAFFAYRYRRQPAIHKRLILIATIALIDAAVGRWPVVFFQNNPKAQDLIPFGFLLAIMLFDLATQRKILKVRSMPRFSSSSFTSPASPSASLTRGMPLPPSCRYTAKCDNSSMKQIARGLFALGVALTIAGVAGCTQLPPPTPLSQLNQQQTARPRRVSGTTAPAATTTAPTSRSMANPCAASSRSSTSTVGAPANDDRVMDAILYGRPMMPALGSNITPQDREDLLAYLHTL